MRRIVLLSDTHHTLEERIFPHLEKSDEIWHAGDIGSLYVTDTLRKFAPIKAVYGNIDNSHIRNEFKKIECFTCEGIKTIMTHIGGYPGKYKNGMKEILKEKEPDLFISGHSHILKVMHDKSLNILHMNPGSIGNYGIHKVKTILTFNIEGKDIKDLRIVEYPK